MKKAFTLIELLIVIVVVAILAGVGMPVYTKAVQRGRQRDAAVQIGLVQAAEKIYKLDHNNYINCANTGACNTALGLDLSPNYTFSVSGCSGTGIGAKVGTIKVTGIGSSSCVISTSDLNEDCGKKSKCRTNCI